jgi:hypothetical protein
MVRLSPGGDAARGIWAKACRTVAERWLDRFGHAEVGCLCDCQQAVAAHGSGNQLTIGLGLRPYPDGWRARGRYRARSDAMSADPWAALPRQPMVLHRGGYRDGS